MLLLLLLSYSAVMISAQSATEWSDYTRNSVVYAGQFGPTSASILTTEQSSDVLKELGVDLSTEGKASCREIKHQLKI